MPAKRQATPRTTSPKRKPGKGQRARPPVQLRGERLVERRNALGLTQTEVSIRTGISSPQYLRYEKGRTDPTLATAAVIARALGLSLDYMAGLTDEKDPPKPSKG